MLQRSKYGTLSCPEQVISPEGELPLKVCELLENGGVSFYALCCKKY